MKIWVIGRHYPSINNRMRGSFEIEQAKMLARGGHDVTYIAVVFHPVKKIRKWGFTTWEEDSIRVCGYSQFFFPEKMKVEMRGFRARILKKALSKVEKEFGLPDVIHVHYPTMITDPGVVLDYRKKGCSVVCTEHWTSVQAKTINDAEKKQLKKYVDNSDCFICVGSPLKKSIEELTGSKRNIEIVPNVVEDFFKPIEKKDKKFFEFVIVGRLVKVKQVDKAIDAFSRVLKEKKNVRLTIVGQGEEREGLENKVAALSIGDRVKFTGTIPREKVAERIARADCLICYSNLETFGVPIIEAWASGVPAISSDALGFAEYWEEGLGYIVDQNDITQLTDAMIKIVDEKFDPDRLHKFAVDHFSETVVRSRLEAIYSKTAKK